MSQSNIYELLHDVAKLYPDAEKQIAVLRANKNSTLQAVLECAFHPKVIWQLPPGNPPFTKNPAEFGLTHRTLDNSHKTLYRFLKCGAMVPENMKREKLFIELLETLSVGEADVLLMMKEKKFSGPLAPITHSLAHAAFPEFIPEPVQGESKEWIAKEVAATAPPLAPAGSAELGPDGKPLPKKRGRKPGSKNKPKENPPQGTVEDGVPTELDGYELPGNNS